MLSSSAPAGGFRLLPRATRKPGIVEGLLSRGDRRIGSVSAAAFVIWLRP